VLPRYGLYSTYTTLFFASHPRDGTGTANGEGLDHSAVFMTVIMVGLAWIECDLACFSGWNKRKDAKPSGLCGDRLGWSMHFIVLVGLSRIECDSP
jgi:hypothetical protein